MDTRFLSPAALLAVGSVAAAGDVQWNELASFSPPVGAGDDYGHAVAIDGNILVVGDPRYLDQGSQQVTAGAVYVYARSGTAWEQEALIAPFDGEWPDNFGRAVALSGDTLLVGSSDDDGGNASGSVYVYTRAGTQWSFEAKLTASDAGDLHAFGKSVDLDGDYALIGANGADGIAPNTGAAYVFMREGTVWTEQAKLHAADGESGDLFGRSVALSGDTALVGAYRAGPGVFSQGAAYVFVRDGTEWDQQAKLVADNPTGFDQAGLGVGLGGDVAAVGAPTHDASAGATFVYERVRTTWTQTATLEPTEGGGAFGWSLSVDEGRIVTGARLEGLPFDSGAVYVHERVAGVWTQTAKLRGSLVEEQLWLGYSVSISGNMLAASGIGNDDFVLDPGIAYVFESFDPVPGERFCFGDGTGTACPCANHAAPDAGCLNGSGRGAELGAFGSSSFTADALTLAVDHMPVGMPGLVFVGDAQVSGGFGVPLFDGLLCVGGNVERGPLFVSDGGGGAALVSPIGAIDGAVIGPGSTVYFQAYFRDALTSVCGAYANLSNGISVTFLP